MSWSVNKDVWVERDARGVVRLVRHIGHPFEGASAGRRAAQQLAVAYLGALGDLLGLEDGRIGFLETSLRDVDRTGNGPPSDGSGPQLRWKSCTELRDETTILMIQQTHDAGPDSGQIDVENAGLRILVHRASAPDRLRITGLSSTLRQTFHFPPHAALPLRREIITALPLQQVNEILAGFGLPRFFPARDLAKGSVPATRIIHRYRPAGRTEHARGRREAAQGAAADPQPGADYVAVSFRVTPDPSGTAPARSGREGKHRSGAALPAYEIIAREADGAPLAARPLVTHAGPVETGHGSVFVTDPITATGDFMLRPNAQETALDLQRQNVALPDLLIPASPADRWRLSGRHVVVDGDDPAAPIPCAGLGISPPEAKTKDGFDFSSRTNDFAAVNAYYHCASMFGRLERYGLPFEGFPMRYELPARIVHRAAIQPGPCSDGRCIDAQAMIIPGIGDAPPTDPTCGYAPTASSRIQFRFALADLALNPGSVDFPLSPLGIACDVRIIWHEFCHALIAGATDLPEFPFAHSAGDALAAIMCDPGSKLAEAGLREQFRGITFPWVTGPNRRHDRRARDGWSWSGPLGRVQGYAADVRDMSGYAREQVLSSTLFRFYRAVGGDAPSRDAPPDLASRTAAADYAAYLIVRAIASLGPAVTVPCVNAGAFASALMDADAGTQRLDTPEQVPISPPGEPSGRVGGTVRKVIRWAFEKQGLYTGPAARRPDGAGEPEPIDLYIEDEARRQGGYRFTANWHAADNAVWNRRNADWHVGHQAPRSGEPGHIYVQVKNRGAMDATDITLSAWVVASTAASWPGTGWASLPLAAGGTNGAGTLVSGGGSETFGPFEWTPPAPGCYSILVSADAEGDRSNINPATSLPCASLPSRLDQLVPFDNNLALAAWTV